MKISYILLIGLLLSLILIGTVSAGTEFGIWTSSSGCWTSTNDTHTRVMWNTSASTQTWTPPKNVTYGQYFVVGGGGGGGSRGQGAGANGTNVSGLITLTNSAYTITIGAGGASDTNGTNSSLVNASTNLVGLGGLTKRMAWNAAGQNGTNVTYLGLATNIFRGAKAGDCYGWDGEGCQTLDVRVGTYGGYGYGAGGGQGGYQDPAGCVCGCPAGTAGIKGVVIVTYMNPPPVVSFTQNISSGSTPSLVVQFNDTSTESPSGWNWSWGDGTSNDTTQNPVHTFTSPGNYNISLSVSNAYGTSSTSVNYDVVVGQLPIASTSLRKLYLPMNGTNEAKVFLDYSDYNHSVYTVGRARVTTTASKFGGSSLKINNTTSVSALLIPHNSSFDYTTNNFYIGWWENSTTKTDGSLLYGNYWWLPWDQHYSLFVDYGVSYLSYLYAGTSQTEGWNIVAAQSMGSVPNRTWTYYAIIRNGTSFQTWKNGVLQAQTTNSGRIGTINSTWWIGEYMPGGVPFNGYIDDFIIFNGVALNGSVVPTMEFLSNPLANYTYTPSSGSAPLTVTFNDTSVGDNIAIWDWDWGDNTAHGTTKNITHQFSQAGIYQVQLTVMGAFGNSSKSQNVTVPMITAFTSNVTKPVSGGAVLFTDNSTNATGWAWFFGDELFTQAWSQQTADGGFGIRYTGPNAITTLPDGSIIMAGGANSVTGTYYTDTWRSTNKGATWTLQNAYAGWLARVWHNVIVLKDGSMLLMGGTNGATYFNDTWRSTDKGLTWQVSNVSSGWSKRFAHESVVLPDSTIVLSGGVQLAPSIDKNDTWVSTDNGTTWKLQNSSSGWTNRSRFGFTAMNDGSIILTGGWVQAASTGYLNDTWRSTDKGLTWTRRNASSGWTARIDHKTFAMPDGSIILIGGYSNAVAQNDTWRSIDYGSTWNRMDTNAEWSPRWAQAFTQLNDSSIVLIGGYSGSTSLSDVYRVQYASSILQNPAHTYTGSYKQTFNVSLMSSNAFIFNSTVNNNYINLSSVQSDFTSNVTTSQIYPLVVQFNDTSYGTLPSTWNWSFGDGRWFNTTNSALKNTSYQYAVAGKYNVTLLVNNTDDSSNVTKIDYINLTSDNDANLTSWLHMNGTNGSTTFIGEKGVAWTRNGGAYITTNVYKYGGASGAFPSSLNSYISTVASPSLNFSTNDFTIEFWVNVTSVAGVNDHIISKTNTPRNRGWGLDRTNSGAGDSGWDFWMGNDSGGQTFFNAPIPNKTWTHIAVERISGTIYLYINGNLTASQSGFNANYDTTDPLWIGRQAGTYFNGYIDEFRISNTLARWKSNFTPPYNEYKGTLETIYPDINPDSTFRYKTNPGGSAYIDNQTQRNRTVQIQNITNTSYVLGSVTFNPLYVFVKSVQLNTTYYATGMTLLSSTIDNDNGIIEFNISKPTGFSPGLNRASILDYTAVYYNYTDGSNNVSEYFGYGYLINGSTFKIYPIHNFLETQVTYGDWNFTANFTADNVSLFENEPTLFTSTFTGSYPNRWNWSFGDGTFNNGTNSSISHIYTTGGLKTVTLTEYLWQNSSVNSTFTRTDYINVTAVPISSFTTNVTTGLPPLVAVQFNDTTINYPSTWNWSATNVTGNNTPFSFSNIQNATYVFGIGNWSISLNTSNGGGSNVSTQVTYINLSYYQTASGFVANTTSGIAPLSVGFNVTTVTDNASIWNWSFGDGVWTNGTTQNVTYTYGNGGVYTIVEIASNPLFDNTTTLSDYITVYNKTATGFIANATSGIAPLDIGFNVTLVNDNATIWNWSFGDGTWQNGTSQNATHSYGNGGIYTITEIASNDGSTNTTTRTNYITLYNQSFAGFTATPLSGAFPLSVNFNVTVVNDNATIWNWSFGDGIWQNGTTQNVTHIYTTGGTYSIIEYASNDHTFMASYSSAGYIKVYNVTIADFTTNATYIVVPPEKTVWFNSTSINATTYNWSFHDGTWQNGTEPNASYTYSSGGNFTINLTTTDTGYGSSIKYGFLNVYNQTISGFIANTTSGIAPSAIGFNVTKVNDNATIWNWSFGDGTWTNGTTQNVTHLYTTGGNFTIIEITSNLYSTNTTTRIEYVNISLYNQTRSGFTANTTSGIAPLDIGFNVTLVNDNATVWNWSFGDGTWQNGTTQNATHSYGNGGVYTIIEIASNPSYSNTTTRTDYITLYNQTVSGFIANATIGVVPHNVGFNVTTVNDNASTWNWSFGDGTWTNGTTQNVTHVYTSAGNFTVTEIASNDGTTNTTVRTNYINVYYSPATTFSATPISGSVPLTVIFNDTSLNGPTMWNWSFGDGTWQNGTTKNATHTYTISGSYTVTLITTNSYGTSNYSIVISALSALPIANFTATPNIGVNPLDVTFTDTSIGDVIGWSWDFGDGLSSNLSDPIHTYSSLGTYAVRLTIQTSVGDNTSSAQYIYVVSSPSPMVDFVGTPTSGITPLTVTFTDLTSGGKTGWNWSFGDGTYSNLQNPTHVYSLGGQYSVTLVVINSTYSNYTSKIGYINVNISLNAVSANYTGTPTSGNYPLTVQFYDTSICNPVCTNWNWDLDGDGSTDSNVKNPVFTYTYPLAYSPKLIASNGINSGTMIHLKYINVGPLYVPTTIPQPTTTWVPGYQNNQTGLSVSFKSTDTNIDLNNGTYLKYWLQNFTATGEFNLYGFVVSIMAPLMHVFGFWIFLIIWGLYLFAVWIRSQDVTLPLIIGIISMGTFGLLFPVEALPVIIIMFVICGAVIITKLMKDSI